MFMRISLIQLILGHDHGYERSYPVVNNIVYDKKKTTYHYPGAPIHILVCLLLCYLFVSDVNEELQVGTAGASLDTWLEQPEWSAHREASFGYTKLEGSLHSLKVVYIRQNLTIGDEFHISKGTLLLPFHLSFCFPTASPPHLLLILVSSSPSHILGILQGHC